MCRGEEVELVDPAGIKSACRLPTRVELEACNEGACCGDECADDLELLLLCRIA